MKNLLFALRSLSSLHCGIGQGLNDIDLPTARHAVSGHPVVPGSSLKGVLKNEFVNETGRFYQEINKKKVEALFGGDGQGDNQFASSVSIGDALTLALPVRSFFGTFAYLASPYTLQMLKNQLERLGQKESCPNVPQMILVNKQNPNFKVMITSSSVLCREDEDKVLLEELDLSIDGTGKNIADSWANLIANMFFNDDEGKEIFKRRFAIVDDDALNFLAETCLPVDAHIAIDEKTGNVKKGALWYEETVSPETLFTGVVTIDRSYKSELSATADELAHIITENGRIYCQIGGKATTGKGFVAIDFHTSVSGGK